MSAAACPFDPDRDALVPGTIRASGEIRARFDTYPGRTDLARLFESGGLRLRRPRAGGACEAVILNTGGGMAGGDRAELAFGLGPDAAVTITTQSAEKIYRAQDEPTAVSIGLDLAARARLAWLPQETILFNGARLRRNLDLAMAADARALLIESMTFGRLAMGETLTRGMFADRWRIRRAGTLVFAEDVRLDGPLAERLDRPALGGGARMVATLLSIGGDAEAEVALVRAALADSEAQWGVSAFNGLMVGRLLSASPDRVRKAILTVLAALGFGAAPRVWQ
jgi:urease accessory protein